MADVEIVEQSTLGILARAEIDQQVATAHAFPRSIAKFQAEALSMATLDEETAASCFYILPRGDGVEGPSVRLAEIVGSAWGNLRYGARIVEVGREFVTAEGVCHDLQRNVASSVSVRRRITTKEGKRFSEDMITVTCNAACSIALRNAIFKVVPFAYVKPIYEKARKVAAGDEATLDAKRRQWLSYFAKQGVTEQRVLWFLNRKATADIDQGDVLRMAGLTNAVKEDSSIKLDDYFPKADPSAPPETTPANEQPASKAAQAAARSKAKKAAEPAKPEAEPSATETQASEPPAAASGLTYGDKLDLLIQESEHKTSRTVALAAKVDYTRLVDAINDKTKLTDVELTKLEAAGVNVKGLA